MSLTLAERTAFIVNQFASLKGKTISAIRPLTQKECREFGWDYEHNNEALVIWFTDGTYLVPMSDPEGNGAGFLYLSEDEGVAQ